MYRREYNIVFPILLISIGALVLLQNAGLLSVNVWDLLWRLWPLLLVAWGLQGLLGRSALGALLAVALTIGLGAGVIWYATETGTLNAAPLNSRTLRQALGDAQDAEVEIDFSIGTLSIASLTDSNQLIEGTVTEGNGLTVNDSFNREGQTVRYRLDSEGIGFFFQGDVRWELNLTDRVPMDLQIHHGVGTMTADLARLNVRELTIDGGVGEIQVTVPNSGRPSIHVDQGVGTLRLIVPQAIEARLSLDGGLGELRIDSRFRQVGEDVYETLGYAGAEERVDIQVDRGLGELIVQ